MAYAFINAYLVPKGTVQPPAAVAIGSMLLYDIFNNFSSGTIVLTNPSLIGDQYVDLVTLQQSGLPMPNITFNSWLGTLGVSPIPASTTAPSYIQPVKVAVTYQDTWATGYYLNRIHPTIPDATNLPVASLTDGLVTSDYGANVTALSTYGLFHVNGYLHRSFPNGTGVQLVGAGATTEVSGKNTSGILNFTSIGALTQIAITPDKVSLEPGLTYNNSAIINLNTDLTNKTLMMSIGGVLHTEQDVLLVLNRSQGIVKIRTGKMDFMERMVYQLDKIDLSSLGIMTGFSTSQTEIMSVPALTAPETIFKYLTLPQTFAIIIDNPNVFVEWTYPQNSGVWGRYTSQEDPVTPMIDVRGRFIPYIRKAEGRVISYITTDDEYRNFIYRTADINDLRVVTNGCKIGQYRAFPRFLKIYTQ